MRPNIAGGQVVINQSTGGKNKNLVCERSGLSLLKILRLPLESE
jgi:hypothetical protein